MITPEIVSLFFLLFLAGLVSYLDIRYRLIDIPYLLFFCGIIGFFASVSYYGLGAVGLSLIPAVAVILLVTVINVFRVQRGKSRIVGGGDRNVYATFCLMCPIVCGIPSALIIPALSVGFAIFAGYIPRVAKAHDSRGMPFCLYMALSVVCCVILNSAAVY